MLDSADCSPLMWQIIHDRADLVERLLQDPRVQASVNVQDHIGYTALHIACRQVDEPEGPAIVQLLLRAGADPSLMSAGEARGVPSLHVLKHLHPTHPTTVALVQQSLDAEKASFLVKARRLVIAATRSTPPSFLQGRVAHRLPLPVVALAPATDVADEKDEEGEETRRKFRTMLARLVGVVGW